MTAHGPRTRVGVASDDSWKAEANCRKVVLDYVRLGWSYERAQRYVTDLYYVPGDGLKPGRPPAGGRVAEEDLFYLPRLWCSTCPVAARCIEEAVETGDIHGFRAGLTPKQVSRVIKIRRREKLLAELGVQRLIVSSGRR